MDAKTEPSAAATKDGDNEKLPFRLNVGFGVGALGMSILLNTPGGILAPFMTNFLGLSAGAVATLLLASKLYDMFTDPIMGMVSDKTESRWGRRRPYLLLGGFVSAIGFILIFNPPDFESNGLLMGYMLVALLVTYTGYTIFNIPYLALPAEMTQSYHGRTVLMTWRIAFVNIGGLFAASAFVLVQWLGNDTGAHGVMALAFGAVILFASVLCFFGTTNAHQTKREKHSYTIGQQIKSALENKPFCLLLGAKLCQLFGLAAASITGVYFKVTILGMEYSMVTIYIYIATFTILAMLPVWTRISKIADKRSVYMFCVVGYALVTLTWLFASDADPLWTFYLRAAALGFFGAGVLIMGPALLPDTIEYDYLKTGIRREGIFAAFYTTMEKLAFAVGPSIVLVILGVFGYQSGTEGLDIEQPESAIFAIYLSAAILPALSYFISLIFLYFYRLSEDRLIEMRAEKAQADAAG